MKWAELLRMVGEEPLFASHLLLVGKAKTGDVRKQLSRWVRDKRLIQVRRGWYLLAEPYRRVSPHPFFTANRIKRASYVSLQSALAYYGMIPEHVPVVTSVTTGRPERLDTPVGRFLFKHIKKQWFIGYRSVEATEGQAVLIAGPEKALLDLVYLTPRGEDLDYLTELRLENLDQLDEETLAHLARQADSRKLQEAVGNILKLRSQSEAYQPL